MSPSRGPSRNSDETTSANRGGDSGPREGATVRGTPRTPLTRRARPPGCESREGGQRDRTRGTLGRAASWQTARPTRPDGSARPFAAASSPLPGLFDALRPHSGCLSVGRSSIGGSQLVADLTDMLSAGDAFSRLHVARVLLDQGACRIAGHGGEAAESVYAGGRAYLLLASPKGQRRCGVDRVVVCAVVALVTIVQLVAMLASARSSRFRPRRSHATARSSSARTADDCFRVPVHTALTIAMATSESRRAPGRDDWRDSDVAEAVASTARPRGDESGHEQDRPKWPRPSVLLGSGVLSHCHGPMQVKRYDAVSIT